MSLFSPVYTLNAIFHNHTPLSLVSLPTCFFQCNTCIYGRVAVYSFMSAHVIYARDKCGLLWKGGVFLSACVCPSLCTSWTKWQCLINGARLCPWFVCFCPSTNMGWNIWVTKIDIMTECALLSSSCIRLANFWGKAKCLGNIISHLSSPSH